MKIAIEWTTEDVKKVCPHLTDEQANTVLKFTEKKHDAEIGVNLGVLRSNGLYLYPSYLEK